jgi:hypothetical protein
MGNMIPAPNVEAIFDGTMKNGKTYKFSRHLQFWLDDGDGQIHGMYLDDQGNLREAKGLSNFDRYAEIEHREVVGVLPGGDHYSVWRSDDGILFRHPIAALLVHSDGEVTVSELDSTGAGDDPTQASNCLGIWNATWGAEPWKDEPAGDREEPKP